MIMGNVRLDFLGRVFHLVLILLLTNMPIIISSIKFDQRIIFTAIIVLVAVFIRFNINPVKKQANSRKLTMLIGGHELLINTCIVLIVETSVYIYICAFLKTPYNLVSLSFNAIIGMIVVLIMMWNGIIRIVATSSQMGVRLRAILLTTWWIPVFNLIVFCKCCSIVRREYIVETGKIELNNIRKENNICKTKYPILLIHGIFWRDWQFFNYWGRIPAELIKNGATIYYGNQQSASAMEICSNEIKEQILSIIENENCEKVNIIAHSKGGLDARYAISCLGMDEYVASLTTICTPHHGCSIVDWYIRIIPDKAMFAISKRYNSTYRKLGDKEPDLYRGIHDVTVKKCLEFNKTVPDRHNVLYQSVTSKMSSVLSAGFPLNIGYAALRHSEGENDGFVSVTSSKWGDFIDCYTTKGRRGVSHGDMIDLMRENISGFDVRECYVGIVKELKEKGL